MQRRTYQGQAHLEATDIELPLPKGFFVHDEGASRPGITHPNEGPEFQSVDYRAANIYRNHVVRRAIEEGGMPREDAESFGDKAMYTSPFIQNIMALSGGLHVYGCTIRLKINLPTGPETHIHMVYESKGRSAIDTYIRAHEEYHAMVLIPGAVTSLEARICSERENPIDFSQTPNEEVAADLNALDVLRRRGLSLSESDLVGRKELDRARFIYEIADYRNLTYLLSKVSPRLADWF
ncbi:hypothetical protein CL619_00095 [archaeon]|nr:hypothetical protein [archaeon]|tara:strand:- start:7761 stop:8471 length:711 start_codon:yes stop_codon:yes gene_type:complete